MNFKLVGYTKPLPKEKIKRFLGQGIGQLRLGPCSGLGFRV